MVSIVSVIFMPSRPLREVRLHPAEGPLQPFPALLPDAELPGLVELRLARRVADDEQVYLTPEWKRFEKLVCEIQKSFTGTAWGRCTCGRTSTRHLCAKHTAWWNEHREQRNKERAEEPCSRSGRRQLIRALNMLGLKVVAADNSDGREELTIAVANGEFVFVFDGDDFRGAYSR